MIVTGVTVSGGAVSYWWQTRDLGPVTSPTTVSARQAEPGHCIEELPGDGRVSRIRLVPCSTEHDAEVVGVLPLGPGDWPGRDVAVSRVSGWCEMDTAQRAAGFTAVIWVPSEAGWAQGDTSGVCVAWFPDGGVTGSWRDGDVRTR